MAKEHRLAKPALTDDDVRQHIKQLYGVPWANDKQGRFGAFRDKVQWQDDHFYKRAAADPKLPPPYNSGSYFQSDFLRQKHWELVTRLVENHFIVRVKPPRASLQKQADALEQVLNYGIQLLELRESLSIQLEIADCQSRKGLAILHWLKADHLWPEVPTYEWLDERPGDEDEAARYEEYTGENAKGKYRETGESVKQRHIQGKARAGFPWFIEVLGPDSWAGREDRSCANGWGEVITVRRIPIPDYAHQLSQSGITLSLNEADKLIPIYGEKDAPPQANQSGEAWRDTCYIATVWTRTECYEAVAKAGQDWEVVKSFKHYYGMPPFATCPAIETKSAEPHERYLPALQGLYDTKPAIDKILALLFAIAEMIALPYYYVETAEGTPALGPDGKVMLMTRNALASYIWPPGHKLVKVEYTLNDAFLTAIQILRELYEQAAPDTGQTPVGEGTRPWTIRLGQSMANVAPKRLIRNAASTIQTMARNMAFVMSIASQEEGGFGEPVYVYAQEKNGKKVKETLVGIAPEDIVGLIIDVDIDATSAAERITLEQHFMELRAAGYITAIELDEDGRGIENASEHQIELQVEQIWEKYQKDKTIQSMLAAHFGELYIVDANLNFIGNGGQPVPPEQVAAGARPAIGGPGPAMPALPAANVPTTMPISGLSG